MNNLHFGVASIVHIVITAICKSIRVFRPFDFCPTIFAFCFGLIRGVVHHFELFKSFEVLFIHSFTSILVCDLEMASSKEFNRVFVFFFFFSLNHFSFPSSISLNVLSDGLSLGTLAEFGNISSTEAVSQFS